MNLLYVYNYYQNPGGEDEPFTAEAALLEAQGHKVMRYSMHNDSINGMNPLLLAGTTIWNREAYAAIRRLVRENVIDVVHFHNTFPLISPAAYYAAKAEGARVIQTLHNFRLICPGSLLSRSGRVCEECLGRGTYWPGVVHACYRDSRIQTAAVAAMLIGHRLAGTWNRQIDLYVALTEFARNTFVRAGFPAERITVKPNFVQPDPGLGTGRGGFALFAGRLSPNKGIEVLLDAWKTLGSRLPLKIAGDGPLLGRVKEAAANVAGIEYLGRQPRENVLALMRNATALIFPSVWYEGFPMTILEAYASGLPVIASDLGSMASIVADKITGLRFKAGSAQELVSTVGWLLGNPSEIPDLRRNARLEFTTKYSAAQNYTQLIRIYNHVLGNTFEISGALTREQYGD
jgi:glycosyltransferase involved in cell wall biosynthesis